MTPKKLTLPTKQTKKYSNIVSPERKGKNRRRKEKKRENLFILIVSFLNLLNFLFSLFSFLLSRSLVRSRVKSGPLQHTGKTKIERKKKNKK